MRSIATALEGGRRIFRTLRAKARGTRLGNPRPAEALVKGRDVIAAHLADFHDQVQPQVEQLHAQGFGLRAIARELNRRGVPTARGKLWAAATVAGVLKQAKEDADDDTSGSM